MVTVTKQVAILSDNDSLARVVELNLSRYPDVQSAKLATPSARPDGQISTGGFDLVVLAIGRLTTDPGAILARISPSQARRTSLLIISSEPTWLDWNGEVYFLSFPFSATAFHHQVQEILNKKTAATTV
jgi:hypothetical protein